ncbi:hypothetical protein [Afipia felis]|uniref:Uncharacterized protein n=1 Tax=Afipia felis TaxID=1035 RepID=A0A380W6W6_AFIFE|nr:hypothetical protein [Afipia felis]SUU76136.1 Uncharacterised protein [Afipia felis]SUU84203.1 Uncharacterised protein [Afipia felis]SUW28243.1 Uncharacterised protein [Afipia felis]
MSIVRENLLTRLGYTPYCGSNDCSHMMPRTQFNGEQFVCRCGWRSGFEPEFIEKYKEAQWSLAKTGGAA